MIEFASPWWLLGLVAIPIVVMRELYKTRRLGAPITGLDSFFNQVFDPLVLIKHLGITMRLLAIASIVVALSRPQLVSGESKRINEGLDIVLALDTSGSMRALDFKVGGKRVDRLGMIKKVVGQFIEERPSDRIGLVVFGTESFTQAPLTLDQKTLLDFVDRMEIGMAGEGTAIGDAIATSVKRLKSIDVKSKLLILLTDGAQSVNSIMPLEAAQAAASFGVKIYTIGIGSHDPVPFPQRGFFGETVAPARIDFDEETLKKVSQVTGGKYYHAKTTSELKGVYEEIDRLEKAKIEVKEYKNTVDIYQGFVWAGLVLIFIELLFCITPYRVIP